MPKVHMTFRFLALGDKELFKLPGVMDIIYLTDAHTE